MDQDVILFYISFWGGRGVLQSLVALYEKGYLLWQPQNQFRSSHL